MSWTTGVGYSLLTFVLVTLWMAASVHTSIAYYIEYCRTVSPICWQALCLEFLTSVYLSIYFWYFIVSSPSFVLLLFPIQAMHVIAEREN